MEGLLATFWLYPFSVLPPNKALAYLAKQLVCFLPFDLSNVTAFPDLSCYLGESSVTITDRTDEDKTQVVINLSFPVLI